MSDGPETFDTIKKRILVEFAAQGFGDENLSIRKAIELREYAKARTGMHAQNPTMEQLIWKSLYDGLTEELRRISPDSMEEIESLEKRRSDLQDLQEAMAAKMKARPHDFGVRVWWAFIIVGVLVGWMRSPDLWSIMLYGLSFWIVGMFFCIFAIDSAEVQSKIAIFLYHRLSEKRISNWLYLRALTIR